MSPNILDIALSSPHFIFELTTDKGMVFNLAFGADGHDEEHKNVKYTWNMGEGDAPVPGAFPPECSSAKLQMFVGGSLVDAMIITGDNIFERAVNDAKDMLSYLISIRDLMTDAGL